MPLLKYVGPIDEVYVRDAGVYVKRGETVDIKDAAIAASLVDQETFEPAPAKSAKPGTGAASTTTED